MVENPLNEDVYFHTALIVITGVDIDLLCVLSVRTSLPVRGTTRRTETVCCGGKITSPKRSAASRSPASSTSRGGEAAAISRCDSHKLETGDV